ncbi:hypothetical protein ABBQ38_014256 [Trebouxia sp. C0009 RCD-2024]
MGPPKPIFPDMRKEYKVVRRTEHDLFIAVKESSLVQVKEILSQGVNANARWFKDVSSHSHAFKRGSTPLHVAAEQGDVSIMNALLAHQADLTITDAEARLPLHRAMSSGHMQVVRLCLEQQDLPDDDGEGLGVRILS